MELEALQRTVSLGCHVTKICFITISAVKHAFQHINKNKNNNSNNNNNNNNNNNDNNNIAGIQLAALQRTVLLRTARFLLRGLEVCWIEISGLDIPA